MTDENDYVFPKEFRDIMTPFVDMDISDCLKSKNFWLALCKHAGMTEEEFEEILNRDKDK